MPDTLTRAAIHLARFAEPGTAQAHAPEIAGEWQAHLDACRIGNPVPAAPETVARREAMANLFARIAAPAVR